MQADRLRHETFPDTDPHALPGSRQAAGAVAKAGMRVFPQFCRIGRDRCTQMNSSIGGMRLRARSFVRPKADAVRLCHSCCRSPPRSITAVCSKRRARMSRRVLRYSRSAVSIPRAAAVHDARERPLPANALCPHFECAGAVRRTCRRMGLNHRRLRYRQAGAAVKDGKPYPLFLPDGAGGDARLNRPLRPLKEAVCGQRLSGTAPNTCRTPAKHRRGPPGKQASACHCAADVIAPAIVRRLRLRRGRGRQRANLHTGGHERTGPVAAPSCP